MAEKKNTSLFMLLIGILIIKVLWIISLFSHFIIKYYLPDDDYYIQHIDNLEITLHYIFALLMGILLIYLYNHLTPKQVCIEGHAKFYLYSFGILSLIGTLQKLFHTYYFREYHELDHEIDHEMDHEMDEAF
jgi:hypothetical protein